MEETNETGAAVGWTCAYTPLVVIEAAGFAPYRVLPLGEPPDQAGRVLHENLCPHVKVVLDRGLHGDLPPLAGVVFMTSCDAMRRLADAWQAVRRSDPVHVMELPIQQTEGAIRFVATELRKLAEVLVAWGGREVTADRLRQSAAARDVLVDLVAEVRTKHAAGKLPGGAARLQALYNEAATLALPHAVEAARALLDASAEHDGARGVPIFLFGNVMPDPGALGLLEACGAHVVDDDLCTGSRGLTRTSLPPDSDPFDRLARALMMRPLCARTVDPARPGALAGEVVRRARACGARGVACHVAKFCDPYLARLPGVREALRAEGLPLLVLEGDCTLRSLGQQRTRIEAFTEMLG